MSRLVRLGTSRMLSSTPTSLLCDKSSHRRWRHTSDGFLARAERSLVSLVVALASWTVSHSRTPDTVVMLLCVTARLTSVWRSRPIEVNLRGEN